MRGPNLTALSFSKILKLKLSHLFPSVFTCTYSFSMVAKQRKRSRLFRIVSQGRSVKLVPKTTDDDVLAYIETDLGLEVSTPYHSVPRGTM